LLKRRAFSKVRARGKELKQRAATARQYFTGLKGVKPDPYHSGQIL